MNNKNLQETQQLNAQARANSTSDGKSKISLTHPELGQSFTNSISSSDLQEAVELNQKSRQNKNR